jgi:hypothetical protein
MSGIPPPPAPAPSFGVQAKAFLGLAHVVDDNRTLETGVLGELTQRLLERNTRGLQRVLDAVLLSTFTTATPPESLLISLVRRNSEGAEQGIDPSERDG